MPSLYRTAQGKVIDMEAMRLANESTVAVGNANLNARGDLLGPGGKVIKTREELAKEYYRKNPNAVKHEVLKADDVVATAPIKVVEEEAYPELKAQEPVVSKKGEKKK